MRSAILIASLFSVSAIAPPAYAQVPTPPPPAATPEPTLKLSRLLAANLERAATDTPISRENAAKAYRKLLEGERHLWAVKNSRGRSNRAAIQANVRVARLAFQDAIDANPRMAEAYTALAELAITAPPTDVDEGIDIALLATKIDKNNFGARRILARLYTFKSGLGSRALDNDSASKAVEEWRFIASLDPRYAEAWAFLSEFYELQGKPTENIAALEKWRSSATPIDTQFFQRMTGGRRSLAPEAATLKLGEALLKGGRIGEAIETLSLVVADEPENDAALDLLREAVESSEGNEGVKAIQALQQAIFTNPGNTAFVSLLAEIYIKDGRIDDAAKIYRDAAMRSEASDRAVSAGFFLELGDLYERQNRLTEAIAAYESAFKIRGLKPNSTLADGERAFVVRTFEKMIRAAKNANRPDQAKQYIERARKMLGPDDEFADGQLISMHRENGKRQDALGVVRKLKAKSPRDESLARLEATLLAEMGRVDEAVAGYQKHLTDRSQASRNASPGTRDGVTSVPVEAPPDVFSNHLFISQLYSQANRGKQAVESANQALATARGAERRQIARLALASAMQMSGDTAGAETTLRDILKESPGNPIALNNLGYFLLERNERFEEALKLIKEAVDTDPTNPSYLDSLGWAYFKLGKLEEAEKYLKEALRYDASSATIHEHLGDVYAKKGSVDNARSQWQKAVERASDAADIARIKGKLEKGKTR